MEIFLDEKILCLRFASKDSSRREGTDEARFAIS